jgi:16S rRNA (cytosine967-C5)-methyltransferase
LRRAILYTDIIPAQARSWDDHVQMANGIHVKMQAMALKAKPSVSPARAAAFNILLRVEQENAYASELLHSNRFADLSAPDHALTTELVMGVLRWRSLLDDEIAAASRQKIGKLDAEVVTGLRIGIYQLRYLQRVPARAAIHESVELVKQARKRSAAPFVNAILRRLSREPTVSRVNPAASAKNISRQYAHPEWLVEKWVAAFGGETAKRICEYDQRIPATAIRLRDPEVRGELREEGVQLTPGRILTSAWRVESGNVASTRAFREGHIAIQDEASQLVGMLAAGVEAGDGRILDCCAAPGGKAAIIAERNPQAQVIAIELHPRRALLTRKLVAGNNVQVVAADARQLPLDIHFDRILVDAPCSGTGTLARNPEIKWRLLPSAIRELQSLQRAILESALNRLAPGGKLVYATCSLEREENSEVVEKTLAEHAGFRVVDCREELTRLQKAGELAWSDVDSLVSGKYLRTLPGVHPCDGFFAAILERVSG